MRLNVLINTYNRPDKLKNLVDKLNKQGVDEIIVFNDGSSMKYPKIEAKHFKFNFNHGKQKYYRLVNMLFSARGQADYYIMLPDDVDIESDFISKAIESWNQIKDSRKICLNLLTDQRKQCWTKFERKQKFGCWLTQWNDMCFIAEEKFFLEVGTVIVPQNRWNKNKLLGSGVGEFISKKLYKSNWNLYQVMKTLVKHGDHESVMNPEARKINPIKS